MYMYLSPWFIKKKMEELVKRVDELLLRPVTQGRSLLISRRCTVLFIRVYGKPQF